MITRISVRQACFWKKFVAGSAFVSSRPFIAEKRNLAAVHLVVFRGG